MPAKHLCCLGYECPRTSDAGVAWEVSSLVGAAPAITQGSQADIRARRAEAFSLATNGASVGLSVIGIFHGPETTHGRPRQPPAAARCVLVGDKTRSRSPSPAGRVPVTQFHACGVDAGRGFTATATTPSANFSQIEGILREVLMGVMLAETRG